MSTNEQTVEEGVGATFQDAHYFTTIRGNARIVNIGREHNLSDLEMLEKFVSFDALHDSSAQDPERICHPGTRQRVLDKIRNWGDDPSTPERILWLHGPAGVGKSAIAQTISSSYGQDQIGASFFFFRSDPIRNDGNRLFPTLAWRLASSVSTVKYHIASSLEEDPDLPRKNIEVQFDRLIARPFLAISSSQSAESMRVIVIDGLDECSDVKLQQRILRSIGNAITDPHFPLRFLISSRTEAHIEDFFTHIQYPILQIDLANADDSSRDIEAYLTLEFGRIAVERDFDPSWPGQQIIQRLISKSAGYFAYVANLIRLVGDPYNDALTQLDIILGLKPVHMSHFSDLDQRYLEILNRMPDKDFLMTFLGLLVVHGSILEYNLSDDDAMLMGISKIELEIRLRRMRPILNLKPHLNVVHKSFLDFLEDSSRSGQYHVSRSAGTRRYLELMMKLLFGHAVRLTTQPNFHESSHFAPVFGKLINHNPQAIKLDVEDWEHILRPLVNVLTKLLIPSNINLLKAEYCQECWFFQIIFDILTHFKSLRDKEDSDMEICLNSLAKIIGYSDDSDRWQEIFDMNFGRHIFGSAAVVGTMMAILAHQR